MLCDPFQNLRKFSLFIFLTCKYFVIFQTQIFLCSTYIKIFRLSYLHLKSPFVIFSFNFWRIHFMSFSHLPEDVVISKRQHWVECLLLESLISVVYELQLHIFYTVLTIYSHHTGFIVSGRSSFVVSNMQYPCFSPFVTNNVCEICFYSWGNFFNLVELWYV